MKFKTLLGWSILFILSFLPVLFLTFLGPQIDLTTYSNFTHYLGQAFGLVGMTMFALTFVLSTRLDFIENIFDGLDKVYIAHGILGGLALTFILFHPIFLVIKHVPTNFQQAVAYLLPGHALAVDFGIIAFLSMIALIFVTLFTKLKYDKWKITHTFLGLVFFFAVLHVFMVRGVATRDLVFEGYYIYAAIVSIIGIVAFFYSWLFKGKGYKSAKYKIVNLNRKKHSTDVIMKPLLKPIEYKSGQFVFLRFFNKELTNEPHPYSIASKSNNFLLRVVIKNLGDYTSRIDNLKIGDKVMVEGPYGRFSFSDSTEDKVWIAGGIGVTPFLGMIEDFHNTTPQYNIDMFYTVKKRDELISIDSLQEAQKIFDGKFNLFEWISDENGYLNVTEIKKKIGSLQNKEFYLCGPTALKESITDNLIKLGVPRNKIYSEEFNFK